MKTYIKIALFTITCFVNLPTFFGQNNSDKIIFLTDFYSTFINKVNTTNGNIDSIYQISIQNPICDNYFLKSEYSDIVKPFFATPIKNTLELKKSVDKINLNEKTIKSKIIGALKKCRTSINNDSLTIYIIPSNPNNRQIIESMSGIMGLTAGSKQIILTVEPDISGWENMLEYAVAHEYNHAYWTSMNFGKSTKWTLLDYLVFEGRGDYFAHLLYPNVNTPWAKALSENQKTDLWNKIKKNLASEDFIYQQEIMFGSMNYPVWGGYAIGFDIVQSALISNKNLSVNTWSNIDPTKILEKSKYK